MPNWVKNIIHIEGAADDIAKALELMRDTNPEYPNDINFGNIIPMPERLNIPSGGYDQNFVALYLKTLCESEIRRLQDVLHDRPMGFYGTYLKKYADSFTIAKGFMDISEEVLGWMKDSLERHENIHADSMEDVGKVYIDNIIEYGDDTWYEWRIRNWGTKWNACECIIGDDYLEFETAWSAPFPIIEELSRRFPELTFCHEWADENLGYNCGRRELRNGMPVSEEDFEHDDGAYEFACLLWCYGPEDLEED